MVSQALPLDDKPSYRELKRLVTVAGLLERQPRYYFIKITSVLLMIGLAVAMVPLIGESWWQMLTAVVFAIVGIQTATIAHDGGHRQIFNSLRKNDLVALLITTPYLGFNYSWWMDQHNRHHGMPNHEDDDPNIALNIWAFTRKQRLQKSGFFLWMAKYQAVLMIPLQSLGAFYKIVESARFVKNKPLRNPRSEILLFPVYFAWLLPLLFLSMAPLQAGVFLVVYYLTLGLALGALIAPNHKGMTMVGDGHSLDFLHWQVMTARNLRGNWFIDWFYGGLNYQIEHHLFPTMPRNRLRDSIGIVKPYCERHGIPYHDAGFYESFAEILNSMHEASAPLREQAEEAPLPTVEANAPVSVSDPAPGGAVRGVSAMADRAVD